MDFQDILRHGYGNTPYDKGGGCRQETVVFQAQSLLQAYQADKPRSGGGGKHAHDPDTDEYDVNILDKTADIDDLHNGEWRKGPHFCKGTAEYHGDKQYRPGYQQYIGKQRRRHRPAQTGPVLRQPAQDQNNESPGYDNRG